MKILHVITGLQRGGAETMLSKLATATASAHENHVVSLTQGGGVRDDIERIGVAVHSLGLVRGQVAFGALLALRRLIARVNPDIIQGWMYHANLAATLATLPQPRRAVVLWNIRQTLADMATESLLTRIVVAGGARLSHMPAAILYNSAAARAQHEAMGYAGGGVCIGNGFDTERFRPDAQRRAACRQTLQIDPATPLIGLVARFHPMKDHANFLAAAARIRAAAPGAMFVMVGAGVTYANPDFAKLADSYLPREATRLLGERPDIEAILPAFDVLALSSSRNEAFPNVLGEAMACGLACVATDVGESAVIVGDCGAIVPPGDAAGLAAALLSLLNLSADGKAAIGARARQRVIANFSLAAIADAYVNLYARLRRSSS